MAATSSDSTGLIASSDYQLNILQLVSSDGTVTDVKGLMLELNLYEDIFSPIMTGDVTLGDALDMISTYGLHGNEFIQVSVDKPSLNNPITKTFRVYKIGNRTMGSNGLQNYTMFFCSEELFLAQQNMVSKSYKGLRIDQMVSDLLSNKLGVPAAKINSIEQTSGVFDIIIPRMNALEAISWLAPRAYGPNKNLFLFFENRDGFSFVSYESLLQVPNYNTYTRDIALVGQDPAENMNTFMVMNIVQDFDIIKATRAGAFSSSLITFDIVSRKFSIQGFNVKSLANNASLNSTLPANDAANRFGQTVYQTTDNMIKFVITTDADPTTNPASIEKWLPQTVSRLGQLNTFKLVGVVPGDIQLKVGQIVKVIIPKMEVQTQATANDPLRTGRYLVSSVHHRFIMDISSTTVELLSDSVAAALATPASTSPAIQTVLKA